MFTQRARLQPQRKAKEEGSISCIDDMMKDDGSVTSVATTETHGLHDSFSSRCGGRLSESRKESMELQIQDMEAAALGTKDQPSCVSNNKYNNTTNKESDNNNNNKKQQKQAAPSSAISTLMGSSASIASYKNAPSVSGHDSVSLGCESSVDDYDSVNFDPATSANEDKTEKKGLPGKIIFGFLNRNNKEQDNNKETVEALPTTISVPSQPTQDVNDAIGTASTGGTAGSSPGGAAAGGMLSNILGGGSDHHMDESRGQRFPQRPNDNMYGVDQTVNLMDPNAPSYERHDDGPASGRRAGRFSSVLRPYPIAVMILAVVSVVGVVMTVDVNGENNQAPKATQAVYESGFRLKPPTQLQLFHITTTASRRDQFKELLLESRVTHEEMFSEPNTDSCQNIALNWISDDDPMQLDATFENKNMIIQRYALMVLYNCLNRLPGNSGHVASIFGNVVSIWENNSNWGTKIHHCDWFGVSCTAFDATTTDDVVQLKLPSNKLHGQIPPEIKVFYKLKELDLSENEITGTIPYHVCSDLVSLKYLSLNDNKLTGTLPKEIEHCDALHYMHLHHNQLNGTIPSQLNHLGNLKHLFINDNYFSGPIPPLPNLQHLAKFHLQNNKLNHHLPFAISQMVSLVDFRINDNDIGGTLPPEMDNLERLETFHAFNNVLVGSIPNVFHEVPNLVDLQLQHNRLQNELPRTLSLCANLTTLILDNNQLSGSIPTEYGNLQLLETLRLSDNKLTGPIPTTVGKMLNLEMLHLNHNSFENELPTEIGNLIKLKMLFLEHNTFNGMVPKQIGNLHSLESIRLAFNMITGAIPEEICELKPSQGSGALKYLDSDCKSPNAEVTCSCCNMCE